MLEEIREKLKIICHDDNDRTRAIFARALPGADVEEAVEIALNHVRSIPDALAFVRMRAEEWGADTFERTLAIYLNEPVEILPETLYGAYGYLDDAFLVVGAAMCVDGPLKARCAWGGLSVAQTQTLRNNQVHVRHLLHPDVVAFQDAMLCQLRGPAEEARRQAARRAAAQRDMPRVPRVSRPSFAGMNRVWNSFSDVYASLL